MESNFNTDEEFEDYLLLLTLPDFLKICLEFFLNFYLFFFFTERNLLPYRYDKFERKKKHPYIDASLTSRSTKSKFLDMLNEKG